MYCELHCHTHYSLLDGASSPEALLDRALALKMPALAITDHDGLYGVVPFWRAARARGIHPVIGAEVTLARGSHLTLLAETQAGYANLSRLISAAQLAPCHPENATGLAPCHPEDATGLAPCHPEDATRQADFPSETIATKGHPYLTIEDVARHANGLLCLSGCWQGAVAQAVLAGDQALAGRAAGRLADIFGRDRVWIELQRHWLPDDNRLIAGLLAVAKATGLGVVATNDVHYATAEGYRLHDVLTATRYNVPLAELGTRRRANNEFHLKGQAEMAAFFPESEAPDALAATQAIAMRCNVSLDFSSRRLPAFPPWAPDFPQGIPPGETAFSVLHALCQEGLRARYRPHQGRRTPAVTPRAVNQLAHELTVIEKTGLADYFLIVWDIVSFARRQGIRCQGRGSAANSLVAYLLGITPVDPLRHDLLFERFLSDRTDTMPDIDIDFAANRRDEVIAYVYQGYGADHAAMVCNVVTYRERSAVRDVARALGFPAEEIGRIEAEVLEQLPKSPNPDPIPASSFSRTPDRSGTVQLLIDLASQLIGTPRHLSVHVGGILITARPLVEVVPLEHATKPGIVVAQWNKDAIEDAGLIKIDLLSLRTLGMLTEACKWIERLHGRRIDLDSLSLDDPAIYALMAEGDVIGCFQVESRAQAQMLPRLKPACFEDLIIEVSIVRPGPIQGGMVHPYLRRRQGIEPVTYLHPLLEPILQETLGIIIFQEQVIRVAVALAGFTPGEADLLRRAMSRSRSAEAMAELRQRFLEGARTKGIDREIAEEAFRQLQGFATYGFCKSHAAAFALVAYQTLWLKAYYPAEFYCALLNHQPMGFYSPEVVVNDARRHGITVLRPDVNRSENGCTLEQGRLRLGLRYLHGLGEDGSARLLAARGDHPFVDLADFCRRTRLPRPLIHDLIRAGALDSLGGPRRQLLWTLGGLHYEEEMLVEMPEIPAELPALEEREALRWDYELLGLSPDDHPMRLLRPRLKARGIVTAAELAAETPGRVVEVAGMVIVRQAPPTAKGHLFITLEDETGLANLIIRPDLYERERALLRGASALVAGGMVQREGKAASMLVRWIKAL
jgi:error-prone DNA polymerase